MRIVTSTIDIIIHLTDICINVLDEGTYSFITYCMKIETQWHYQSVYIGTTKAITENCGICLICVVLNVLLSSLLGLKLT